VGFVLWERIPVSRSRCFGSRWRRRTSADSRVLGWSVLVRRQSIYGDTFDDESFILKHRSGGCEQESPFTDFGRRPERSLRSA